MKSTVICKGCGKSYETSLLKWQNADFCKECFNKSEVQEELPTEELNAIRENNDRKDVMVIGQEKDLKGISHMSGLVDLNKNQKIVVYIVIGVISLMFLFPPFYFIPGGGRVLGWGYRFFLSSGSNDFARVDTTRLINNGSGS